MLIDQETADRLERYRRRYEIAEMLQPLDHLREALSRRETRKSALRRRIASLEIELSEARGEMAVVDHEIAGSRLAEGLLIADLLDRATSMVPETWSPVPVLGFRMWSIGGGSLRGVQQEWTSASMSATCLNLVPDDDVPHSVDRCGPPACGVYATKSLHHLHRAMGRDVEGRAVGVVAMTGRVVEHEHGYRASHATATAVAATLHGKTLVTDDASAISSLFESPSAVIGTSGTTLQPSARAVESYLNEWKDVRETWTWEES